MRRAPRPLTGTWFGERHQVSGAVAVEYYLVRQFGMLACAIM
jgi:hypothetical protein